VTDLGNYTLHEEIGRGGFATVYQATQINLKRKVALKVLSPAFAGEKTARQRFIQEAQTASALDHPNIVKILDLDDEQEQVYIAMEYFPAGDLAQYMRHNKLTSKEILTLLEQVAAALDYAHDNGVLHRDIKPANILLGEDHSAHLCDFGLVRVAEAPRMTTLGSVVGSASYISPEQAEGKPIDRRADQYSLAVMSYEMFTGQVPFHGETSTAIALMHITKAPPNPRSINPDLAEEIEEALLKGLSKDPARRYATCREFVQALEGAHEASQRRRLKELISEAQALLSEAKLEEAHSLIDGARRLLLENPEMQESLAGLENTYKAAQGYQQLRQGWAAALQKAQGVLETYPDYPDQHEIFPVLGLRKKRLTTAAQLDLARQVALGLVFGLPALWLMLRLAIMWITKEGG
jgi:serine/threonine protein kinase